MVQKKGPCRWRGARQLVSCSPGEGGRAMSSNAKPSLQLREQSRVLNRLTISPCQSDRQGEAGETEAWGVEVTRPRSPVELGTEPRCPDSRPVPYALDWVQVERTLPICTRAKYHPLRPAANHLQSKQRARLEPTARGTRCCCGIHRGMRCPPSIALLAALPGIHPPHHPATKA